MWQASYTNEHTYRISHAASDRISRVPHDLIHDYLTKGPPMLHKVLLERRGQQVHLILYCGENVCSSSPDIIRIFQITRGEMVLNVMTNLITRACIL